MAASLCGYFAKIRLKYGHSTEYEHANTVMQAKKCCYE